jgi:RimJ/RimL family protein N-acetyltransferase
MARSPEITMTPLSEPDLNFLRVVRNAVREHLGTKELITPERQDEWYFTSYAEDSAWLVFIARDGAKPVGYGQIKGHDDDSYEIGCAVLPDEQNRGYGTAIVSWLLTYLTSRARSQNVWLWVYDDNRPALALYQKMGFKMVRSLGDKKVRMELANASS